MAKNYWMVVLSPENFSITIKLGFKLQGLKAQHHRKAQRAGPGDRMLFFISEQRRFAATASVTSPSATDPNSPWQPEGKTGWAYKVDIQPNCVLAPEDYIDANLIAPRMDYVRRWIPEQWYLAFQGNLHLLPKKDFQLIEDEMQRLNRQRLRLRRPSRTPLNRRSNQDIGVAPN